MGGRVRAGYVRAIRSAKEAGNVGSFVDRELLKVLFTQQPILAAGLNTGAAMMHCSTDSRQGFTEHACC